MLGVHFNDPYGPPGIALDGRSKVEVTYYLIDRMRGEDARRDLAFGEVLLDHLKVLLILASRIKTARDGAYLPEAAHSPHPILMGLRDLIERNHRTLHSPSDYARRLHVTPKTLAPFVREHHGATPTDLIRNRVLIHTEGHRLFTLRPVKELARGLGSGDELYVKRLLKEATGCCPTFFRSVSRPRFETGTICP